MMQNDNNKVSEPWGQEDHDRGSPDPPEHQQRRGNMITTPMFNSLAPQQQQERTVLPSTTDDPFAPLAFNESKSSTHSGGSGESKLDSSSHHVRRTLGRFGLRGESDMDVPIAVSTSFGSDSGSKTPPHYVTTRDGGREGSGFIRGENRWGEQLPPDHRQTIQSSASTRQRPAYSFDTTAPEPTPASMSAASSSSPFYQQQQQQQRPFTNIQDRMDTSFLFRRDNNDNISNNNNNNDTNMAFGNYPTSPHLQQQYHHQQQQRPQRQFPHQQHNLQPLPYLGSGGSSGHHHMSYRERDDLYHQPIMEPLEFQPSSAGTSPGLSSDTLSALQSSLLNVTRSATNTAPLSPLGEQHTSYSREHEMLPPRTVAMQQHQQQHHQQSLAAAQDFHQSFSSSYDDEDEEGEGDSRFKPFHEEKWAVRYKELLVFHQQNGHAAVPHTYPPNPQLARWVKRQRRQCKLLRENKPSTMTQERLDLLNQIEFIWDSHEVNWREKLLALDSFRREHGHCNVPSNYTDKKLATWVKCQRRQYKLYWDGKGSAMCPKRINELESRGFEWEIRSSGPKRSVPPPPLSPKPRDAVASATRPRSTSPLSPSVFLPQPRPTTSEPDDKEHNQQQKGDNYKF